ncbi:MAG: iron uptake porin [Pseudanabaenaceae cyanobacterium]
MMAKNLTLVGGLAGTAFLLSMGAQAQMVGTPASQILERVNELQGVTPSTEEVAQVTSVSELSDVKPTDWAFSALQSLVERYGCIEGYPDRTYRGQRALSRFEFAAGLNACLDKVNELISAGLADKVSKDDLASLQRLQEEFAAELAAVKGRLDTLEGKVKKLEGQQVSTTTKLSGEVIFGIAGAGTSSGFGPSLIAGNGKTGTPFTDESTNVIASGKALLNFNTSFTGKDLLVTRLESGIGGSSVQSGLAVNPAGNLGFLGFGTFGQDFAGLSNTFAIGKLTYDFPLSKDFKVTLGAVMTPYDYIDFNSFANVSSSDFSSTFFINSPFAILVGSGSGAVLQWNPGGGDVTIKALYIAQNANAPTAGLNNAGIRTNRGLTGDPYQGSLELEFAPKDKDGNIKNFALRLLYNNASVSNATINTGVVNFEYAFSKKVAIFGRYAFGTIDTRSQQIAASQFLSNFVNKDAAGNSISPQTWMAGFAFPELFRRNDLLGIAVGQPFIDSKVGNTTQTNLEVFYRFPVSDNITITPDLQVIFNPNNNSENSTITIGSLRTTFTF